MRKIFSLLLSLIMLISLALPSAGALAEEVQAPAEAPAASVTEKDAEPEKEAAKEAAKEPTAEPTKEPTPVPTAEPTPEPTKEPDPEPADEPTVVSEESVEEEPVSAASEDEEAQGEVSESEEQTEVGNNDENTAENTEIQTEVENNDENVTEDSAAAEEVPAEPTEEPAGKDADATSAPSVENTAAPTEEATAEPTVEATAAPEAEVTAEPTAVPENNLSVSLKLNDSYAMAEKDTVTVEVSVAGGTAPYNVSFYAMKGDSVAYENISEQGENFKLSYEPTEFGKYELVVSVKDANGSTGSANAALEVAVPEVEDEAYWKKMAEKIDLTGDWREDLVNFAKTQVGYKASERNYIYNDDGEVCRYTRYGDWYGKSYSEWCTMFVSFCMNYAGIEEDDFGFYSNCNSMMEDMDYLGIFKSFESGYEPKAGDLVFFNWKEGEKAQHIGIVVSADEDGIKTIEGNVGEEVVRRAHEFEEKTIVGYANLKAMQDRAEMLERAESEAAVAVTENVEGHIIRTNTDRVNLRSQPNTSCDVVRMLKAAGTEMTVIEAVVSGDKVWYKADCGGKTGYIRFDLVLFDVMPKEEEEIVPVEPVNAAWEGASEKATAVYSLNADAVYSWEKLVDGAWMKVEGADASELSMDATCENLKYSYRCTAVLESGETFISSEITLVNAEIAAWLNENVVTQEMLLRAMDAKTLDSLVIEGANVVHVRTGETVAYFDTDTGYMTDAVSGIAVARVDMETGMVYPVE